MTTTILVGDCRERLRTIPDASVHCCVTSPPYFGLRNYGHEGQMGLEPTPDEFVSGMVEVFREVRRVLRDDGTLWLNLGDSYWTGKGAAMGVDPKQPAQRRGWARPQDRSPPEGLKPKDLIGIPWRVAFALQADGWYLRQDIIWHKPNAMPESVQDRCTKAHEYIFMLSKTERYFYDYEVIKVQSVKGAAGSEFHTGKTGEHQQGRSSRKARAGSKQDEVGKRGYVGFNERYFDKPEPDTRNKRSVWTVTTKPFKGAHFATFPPDLIEPCILAGCPVGGTVLDPFFGAGTTGLVAQRQYRHSVGIELNPAYAEMARERLQADGMFADVQVIANDNSAQLEIAA